MQAPRAQTSPQDSGPAGDSEIPPWQAAYVTCPACHRPVRRERLATHMEILHAGQAVATPEESAEPQAEPAPHGLRRLLRKVFGRGD